MTRGPARVGGASRRCRVPAGDPVAGQAGGVLSGVPLDEGVVVVPVVGVTGGVIVDGVVVVEAVDAADGSVVVIGVLVEVDVLVGVLVVVLDVSDPLTFDVAAVAAPLTFSLMTGAASLACCAVCCTFGLLLTRVAAWRSCS